MSTNSYIRTAHKKFVKDNSILRFVIYSNWYVGITQNEKDRKSAHGNPKKWKILKADSVEKARDLEREFLKLGMKGDVGGGTAPDYIYIYKLE